MQVSLERLITFAPAGARSPDCTLTILLPEISTMTCSRIVPLALSKRDPHCRYCVVFCAIATGQSEKSVSRNVRERGRIIAAKISFQLCVSKLSVTGLSSFGWNNPIDLQA